MHLARNLRAVFFDHDDTLFDTIGTKWAQHKHVARTYYGKELTDEEIAPHWGKPLGAMICLLYDTTDRDTAMANVLATYRSFPKRVYPETINVLKHVHSQGLLIGIVTATHRFSFECDLDEHAIPRETLSYTQTADESPFHKPDPRVFDQAIRWLAGLNIRPDEALYIGDSLYDFAAAGGAGFKFLGVETGLITAAQFRENGASSIPSIGCLLPGES